MECKFVDKHNGFVIVGKDLSFYKVNSHALNLRNNLVVKEQNCSLFEGISFFSRNEKLVTIDIGLIGGFTLSQAFVNTSPTEEWPFEDLNVFREILIKAVDFAISKLSIETRRTIFGHVDKCYEHVVKMKRDFDIIIPISEVALFGVEMNRGLAQFVSTDKNLESITAVYSVVSLFGQDAPLKYLTRHLGSFHLAGALEYVVHFRRDYLPSKGFGAFWKRGPVCSRVCKSQPDEEYYPGLLSEHGHFRFKSDIMAGGLGVPVKNFGTNLFADVTSRIQTKHGKLFAMPFVYHYLANKLDTEKRRDVKPETLPKSALEMVKDIPDVIAHVEIVVSNQIPEQFTLVHMVNKFQSLLETEKYGQAIVFLEMKRVEHCIQSGIRPCANTLQDLLNAKQNGETTKSRDLGLALACEAIICYVFYGTTLPLGCGKVFKRNLLDHLGLKKSTFEQGEVFRGVKALRNLATTSKTIRINEIPGFSQCYRELNLQDSVAKILEELLNSGFLSNSARKGWMIQLAQLFCKHFVVQCACNENVGQKMKRLFQDLRETPVKRERFVLYSSSDLVKFIVSSNIDPWNNILCIMREDLGEKTLSRFLKHLAVEIDNIMYKNITYLIVTGEKQTPLLVLPFNQTQHYSLKNLLPYERNRWMEVFEQVASLHDTGYWKLDLFKLLESAQVGNRYKMISGNEIVTNLFSGGVMKAPIEVIYVTPSQ